MHRYLLATAIGLVLSSSAHADPIRQPLVPIRQPLVAPPAMLEQQFLTAARNASGPQLPLLRSALIASGVQAETALVGYEARFRAHTSRLQQETAHVQSVRDQAATILTLLHRDILTGSFDPHCGSVAETLDAGRYNCVTATILYTAFAETLGLPVSIWHAPGHVRLRIDARTPLELEPTCPDWFKQSQAQLLAWRSPPRSLSRAALVGKLYYNQGVAAFERKQFAQAATALQRSLSLDAGDLDARHNLLAALNNGALAHCGRQDFAAADAWLATAAQLDPQDPILRANELHLYGQWVIFLCESSQYAQAMKVVEQGAVRHPDAALFQDAPAAVYRLWVESLLRRGQAHAALARVEEGLAVAPDDAALLELKTRLRAKNP